MTRRNEAQPRPIYVCHPPFEGEPFVQTRITSGAYDIRLLPADFSVEEQVNFVRAQLEANRLPVCLVHPDTRRVGAYFHEDGRIVVSPRREGGVIFAERFAPRQEFSGDTGTRCATRAPHGPLALDVQPCGRRRGGDHGTRQRPEEGRTETLVRGKTAPFGS